MRREHRALTRLALPRRHRRHPPRHQSRLHAAHAQLDRRRTHAGGAAARRRLLPRRLPPAAPAARRQRDPQRSCERNELARHARRPPRPRGFPARDDVRPGAARWPAPWATTTCVTCSSTSAPIFRKRSPRASSASSRSIRWSRESGWPPARRSICSSRARSCAGAIAKARAIARTDADRPQVLLNRMKSSRAFPVPSTRMQRKAVSQSGARANVCTANMK